MENLLDEKFGKHDYDWLLSPPETPVPNGRSSTRSVSTTRASRLSAPHSENSNSTRPVRSRSATLSSISNNRTSVLNGSLASVTSQIANQGKHSVIARSSSTPARSSTPVRTRAPSPSGGVKTARPQRNSRPSSPTNLNRNVTPLASRSNSRSSTPTQRPLTPTIVRSRSVGQIPKPKAGLISPATRAQVSVQPSERQKAAMTASVNSKLDTTSSLSRRHSLPLVSNGHDSKGMSRNSLDMELRYMTSDKGQVAFGDSSVFPHSIHSEMPKNKPDHVVPVVIQFDRTKENDSCNGADPPNQKTLFDSDDMAADRSPS